MRRQTSRPIRLALGLAACTTLALAACGGDSDGDSEGGTEAFCADLLALNEAPDDISDDEGVALLQTAADSAPDEISSEMNEFVDQFERLLAFDEAAATDEELAEFAASMANFDESTTKIEEFAKANCPDLPDDFFN
jgi:hypothetical protein